MNYHVRTMFGCEFDHDQARPAARCGHCPRQERAWQSKLPRCRVRLRFHNPKNWSVKGQASVIFAQKRYPPITIVRKKMIRNM